MKSCFGEVICSVGAGSTSTGCFMVLLSDGASFEMKVGLTSPELFGAAKPVLASIFTGTPYG